MRVRLLILIAFLCLAQAADAVRAKTDWRTYTQPDGTQLTLTLWGDAHFNCYRAKDGTCYSLDEKGFHVISPEEVQKSCERAPRAATRGKLKVIDKQWDPSRTYRQCVILVSFQDLDFSMPNPQASYDSLFNYRGYSYRNSSGCVADYFRDQSNGLFNVQFDVYGPIRVSESARNGSTNDGESAFRKATLKAIDSLHVDFSPYDWDQDGEVDQVVYISAGYCANIGGSSVRGYLWPNTGWFSQIKISDNLYLSRYSGSSEKWYNDILCGLGTICHEFSHCLGLPDLYPTGAGGSFSVVDEWDLMDGGNFTDWGWCPTNYSVLEKYLLGWATPEEFTASTRVYDLLPLSQGGKSYIIHQSESEYYLLENRQQKGWDLGLPGKGLVITYVNYDDNVWTNNMVNAYTPYRYDLVHADGMSYDDWDFYITSNRLTEYLDNANRMNRRYLSTAPYPLISDTKEVTSCLSLPSPVTNIQMTSAGRISFDVSVADDIEMDVPVSESGKGTFYHSKYAYQLPADCVAKVVTAISSNSITCQKIASGSEVIPKGVPVIIERQGGAGVVHLVRSDATDTYMGENYLVGSDEPTETYASAAQMLFYKQSYGQGGSQFGWYWGADEGAAFRIGGHRAWLAVPKSAGTRSFIGDETTAILSVDLEQLSDDRWYDLQGRHLEGRPSRRGIYIVNGKKVVVK